MGAKWSAVMSQDGPAMLGYALELWAKLKLSFSKLLLSQQVTNRNQYKDQGQAFPEHVWGVAPQMVPTG